MVWQRGGVENVTVKCPRGTAARPPATQRLRLPQGRNFYYLPFVCYFKNGPEI